MADPKKTDDWQAQDHIEELKKVPDMVDCNAAPAVCRAMIFFGRQVGDIRTDMRTLPAQVAKEVLAQLQDGPPAQGPRDQMRRWAGLGALGLPTPVCVLLFLIGKSKGWW